MKKISIVLLLAAVLLSACGKTEESAAGQAEQISEASTNQVVNDVSPEVASLVQTLSKGGYYGWIAVDDGENGFGQDVCARFIPETGLPSFASLEVFGLNGDEEMLAIMSITFITKDQWSFSLPEVAGVGQISYLTHKTNDDFKDAMLLQGNGEKDGKKTEFMIMLRPWGQRWEDMKEKQPAYMPANYDDWYLAQIQNGKEFPYPKK